MLRIAPFIVFILVSSVNLLYAQNENSFSDLNEDDEENIEQYTSKTQQIIDFAFISDAIEMLKDQRVNVNDADEDDFNRLHLNNLQIENLKTYIQTYGPLSGLYELNLIEGFDSVLITHLTPYISFERIKEPYPVTVSSLAKETRHTVLSRWQITPETKEGYKGSESAYAGSPEKVLLKYDGRFHDRLRFGITTEKDPGESLTHGFDFYSIHFIYKGKGFIKTLALGDYTLHFAQGLTLSNGFNFNLNPSSSTPIFHTNCITASTGANESGPFRGGAVSIVPLHNTLITLLFSKRRLDGNLNNNDSINNGNGTVSSLYETGLHRTQSEIANKDVIGQNVYGVNLQSKYKLIKIGATVLSTHLTSPVSPRQEPYNVFSFRGCDLLNYGIDMMLMSRYFTWSSEVSGSDNGGKAYISTLSIQPSQSYGFTAIFRHYGRDYQNFFSNSYSKSTQCANEQGIYTSIYINPRRGLMILAYADNYQFPWLKYRINHPSAGHEYALQVKAEWPSKTSLLVKYSFHSRPLDEGEDHKNSLRFQLSYSPLKTVVLKNRIELLKHSVPGAALASGYLIYQDINYESKSTQFLLSFRYALFNTASYNECIYASERDVLYAWSIPAYSYKGSRYYLMAKCRLQHCIDLWVRYSHDFYPDKAIIGTGNETITGNTRSELTLQVILRL